MATEKTKGKVDSQMREDTHKHGKNEHRYKIRGMLMDGERRMEMTLSEDNWHWRKLMMISELNILSNNQATADIYMI
jgi:hypothetical protein